MEYQWDRLIGSIVWPKVGGAATLGVSVEDMMQVGRLAAFKAEQTWEPGGRSLSSWVWLNVSYDVRTQLIQAGKAVVNDPTDWTDDDEILDSVLLVKEALGYLKASIPEESWTLLWLRHAEGYNCRQLADRANVSHGYMRRKMSALKKQVVTLFEEQGIVGTGG